MVNEINNKNLCLINAPAGSGKTTTIKQMVTNILLKDINASILCITYTNRAAEELMLGIESKKVQIQTIHSFISSFMSIYFSHKEILNLYFEVYADKIRERIDNASNDEHIAKSNNKYIETYGELNYETVVMNISKLQYNELPFNTLYFGGLCHDDLIIFSKLIIDRYPIIKKRISQKYKYIFIDEYQDTSSEVLKIFYESVKGGDTKLYLFGDKMQQIYKNYDGSFEEELKHFNSTRKLDTNYRSVPSIINVLNNIYNDSKFVQHEYTMAEDSKKNKNTPRVLICRDMEKAISDESIKNPEALKLYVFNKQRFTSINCGNLYHAVECVSKYHFGSKYSAVDVLTNDTQDNPDKLFRLLFSIRDMYKDYELKQYGKVIQLIKFSAIYNKEILLINIHSDKMKLNKKLVSLFKYFSDKKEEPILELLRSLISQNIVHEKYLEDILDDEEYENVLKTHISEFVNLTKYLEEPHVSTQHGVKGEGHNSVFFISEDSNNPLIKMYSFFDILVKMKVNFTEFQDFYYTYLDKIKNMQDKIKMKISELNKDAYTINENFINQKIKELYEEFKQNNYFKEFYISDFNDLFKKPGVTKVKKCLNTNTIYGVLSAYKLFYVGCSRARERLTIFIDENKIKGDKVKLIEKLSSIGFEVINC